MEDYLDEHRSRVSRPVAVGAAIVLALGLGGYALHEHRVTQSLAAENAQVIASLNATRSQIDSLTATVKDLATRPAAQPAPPAAASAPASSATTTAVHGAASAHRRPAADPRFTKLQSQLDAQGKEIEDTRNDLTSARTELTGSIARTHDELVVLEKKGERNYYEFDINKSKEFQRNGPLGIRLRKANDKHQYADLELMVDDRNLTQKHVNLYQPVMFYTPDTQQPVELVINSVTKNHIHGYVSAPKYRQSELASMSNAAQAGAAGSDQTSTNASTTTPPRQKLPMPQPQQ
jgi:hypothetical protein